MTTSFAPRLLFGAMITATLLAVGAIPGAGQATDASSAVRLEARPSSVSVETGQTTSLQVVALDAQGNVVDAPIRVIAARNLVTVAGETVSGVAAGEGEITAVLSFAADSGREPLQIRIPVTVRWPSIERVLIDAPPTRLYAGTAIRHRTVAFHADGSQRPDAPVLWTTSDPDILSVDRFGNVRGVSAGSATLTASVEGVESNREIAVAPFTGTSMEIRGGTESVRTGDVQSLEAVVTDAAGQRIEDLPVLWATSYQGHDSILAPSAPAQIDHGRVVADVPGLHTVVATAGPLTASFTFEAEPRGVIQEVELSGQGHTDRYRTTDFWVFEGLDGRDYVVTGSKVADGFAFVWDVTDPTNIVKTDSVQVDARTINDVKVSPDGRYATVTREGASNRQNYLVVLDLADPAHPVVASQVEEGITGGIHNAFPTDDYAYILSNGDKYVIVDMSDIYNPRYVGEYDHPNSRLHDVWVLDGIAYSAEWGNGVVAVDVGNGRWGGTPENPVLINTFVVPDGSTHAAFPYLSQSTGKFYVFIGDEIMSRRGMAWGGYKNPGSYSQRFDPTTGENGFPLTTTGYIQIIDFTDPENPIMAARYQVPEYGTHNIWVEDDKLYQAYYEGGLRVVDVSGDLMGNLYTQGREIAVYKSVDPTGFVANAPMVWSAMPHKGYVFFSDTNSGIWAVKLLPAERPVM